MSRLESVLCSNDLPEAELQAARLDGELYAVSECFCPIDVVADRHHRGRSLSLVLPRRVIAEQLTAAWVLGAIPFPPQRHQLCADVGRRVRSPDTARASVREVVIDDAELLSFGGLRVTTPLRTVIDLARFSPDFGDREREVVRSLMAMGGFGVDECDATMNRRRNLPGKAKALARIRESAQIQLLRREGGARVTAYDGIGKCR
jgi:hypothetical protein